jgi:hypothetical protein
MTDTVTYEAPVDEYVASADEADEWNGKSTRLTLAYPLVRDFAVVAEGEQITVKASLADPHDRNSWRGPEADHVRDLVRLGHIAGSEQAEARRQETEGVAYSRGVGDVLTDDEGKPVLGPDGKPRRKFLELRPMTGKQMRDSRIMRNGMYGDQAVMQNSEQREGRSGVKELTEVIEKLVSGGRGSYAGADGPESAAAPDGSALKGKK